MRTPVNVNSVNPTAETRFVSLGMYAFTPALRRAWQALFDLFLDSWPESGSLEPQCCWAHKPADLDTSSLLFGHSCGYPLTHQLAGRVIPFCVPAFDFPGCLDTTYSSVFIAHKDSSIDELADSRGKVAACNNLDSNSGMNVLRYAVAALAGGRAFFHAVRFTGGHLASMQSVASGEADIAAIDTVSYHLALETFPELADNLRCLGFSQTTTALPLVYRADDSRFDPQSCLVALNQALGSCEPWVKQTLRLRAFLPITLQHYDNIKNLETAAIDLGYKELK